MLKTIRWGCLGTGYAARLFAQGLRFLPDAQLLAVGSRTLTSAAAFARQWDIPRAYESYEDLVQDKDIDVVYIATPASRHKQDCLLCLKAGKPVLCEKPFTLNASEASEVITLARQNQLFCMEAMWMRFIPLIQRVQTIISSGTIGEISMLTADFGYPVESERKHHYLDPQLGGGALLDRGVYPLALAFQLLGSPTRVVSQAAMENTGADRQSAIILGYPQGQLAILSATLLTLASNQAIIMGTEGQIRIHAPFYRPHKLTITKTPAVSASANSSNLRQKLKSYAEQVPLLQSLYLRFGSYLLTLIRQQTTEIVQPFRGNGYNYEAAEVMHCLRSGKLESEKMPLDQTLSMIETMDIIRRQWH